MKTDAGAMNVSSPELTALDLLRYPHAAGGVDHIATTLSDLGASIDARKLAALSSVFERSVVQRLGFLLDRFAGENRTRPLHKTLASGGALPWAELDPSAADPDFALEPVEENEKWRVIVRRMPEPDE
jgi:predicted transcriptional regulator of viral defense system